MADLERANEENTDSTMDSNKNKLGYFVTQKNSTSLSCSLRDM